MCTLASDCVRSPLPSLVTMIDEPVSAIRKLAPVMPTSAARNFSRRIWRASPTSVAASVSTRSFGRCVCTRRKSASTCSCVRWMAGAMMWLGRLLADLHQVLAEIGLDHLEAAGPSRCALRPISSETIDLPLVTILASALAADLQDDRARVGRGRRPMHLGAGRRRLRLPGLEVEVEVGERVVLDVAADVAQRLELRQAVAGGGALCDQPGRQAGQRPLQLAVGERRAGVALEGERGDVHEWPICSLSPSLRGEGWGEGQGLVRPSVSSAAGTPAFVAPKGRGSKRTRRHAIRRAWHRPAARICVQRGRGPRSVALAATLRLR